MPATYTMPSDQAYREVLGVLPAGQRWFAFDVPMAQARKGHAKRFGMTLWNYHTLTGTRDFEAWAITREPASNLFWCRVAKERDGETSNNRKSLWDALRIAINMPDSIPMKAVLKDGKTHRCAPAYVFSISDVREQADGSALWLKLEVPGNDVGTGFNEEAIPAMVPIQGPAPLANPRSGILPEGHYAAVRDAAMRVYFEGASRSEEIETLVLNLGMNKSTAEALFNNFRCLVEGQQFKAPMRAAGLQLFADAIIAKAGDIAVPKVIVAIDGYVSYAAAEWGNPSKEMRGILAELKDELAQGALLQSIAAVASASPDPSAKQENSVPSQILREVWVRGPQHAAFRRELLRRWKDRCSVHSATCNDQLRASHIVAWSRDETIRGDVNNGLLLSVPLDNLFDRGLISFDDEGALLWSNKLSPDTAQHFGVSPGLRLAWDHLQESEREALRINLARHREQHKDAGFPK